MTEPADLCAGYQPDNTEDLIGVMDPDRLDALIGKVIDIERQQDAEVPLAADANQQTRGTHTTTHVGAAMTETTATVTDDSDFDITETIAVLPSTGTKGGRAITTEVYYYFADDGAFISVADGNQGLVDLKGPEAVRLGLHLIAAGRRAIELETR